MKKKTNLLSLLVIAFMLLSAVGCGKIINKDEAAESKVIATVNGEDITQDELDQHFYILKVSYEIQSGGKLDEAKDKEMIDDLKNQAFDDLVLNRLVLQELKAKDIVVDTAKIDENIDYIKNAYNQQTEGGFEKFLQDNEITEAMLRNEITTEQNFQALQDEVTKDITITQEEISQYYDNNVDEFRSESGIHIYHILVKEEDLAEEIIARVQQGEDFTQLAGEFSIDESNKNQGGDLGLVNENTNFVEEFKTPALNMEPNQLLDHPVESQFGFHIIRSGEREEAKLSSLNEVEGQIKQQLEQNKKNNTFTWHLDDLRNNAEVTDLR